MNKSKIQTISYLVLFLLVFNLPLFAYEDRYILLDSREKIASVKGSISESFGRLGASLGTYADYKRKQKLKDEYLNSGKGDPADNAVLRSVDAPDFGKEAVELRKAGIYGSSIREGLGVFFRDGRKNQRYRDYIKTCNDPLLDVLEPEDAMKLIIEKGIRCPGNKITNKAK